jgi:methylmalonyl-CoA epimerase
MTASGTPRRPASSAAVPSVPSPPATATRSGAQAAAGLELVGLAAEGAHVGAVAAHPLGELLRVEPPSGGRVGDQRDPHAEPGYLSRLRPMFGRIDHVGLAVSDLEEAIDLHVNVYGLTLVHRETVESQGVEAALLDVGENHVELLAPLHDDTPVGKFLAKRGPGLHHVAYQVDDIEAVLRRLRDQGCADRRVAAPRHPAVAGGVPASFVLRWCLDRDRPTGSSPCLIPTARRRSASPAARCSRSGSRSPSSTSCAA